MIGPTVYLGETQPDSEEFYGFTCCEVVSSYAKENM